MLGDALLRDRYRLARRAARAGRPRTGRCSGDPVFEPLAAMYAELYRQNYDDFTVLYARQHPRRDRFLLQEGPHRPADERRHERVPAHIPLVSGGDSRPGGGRRRIVPVDVRPLAFRILDAPARLVSRASRRPWAPTASSTASSRLAAPCSAIRRRGTARTRPFPARTASPIFIRDVAATDAVWSEHEGYPSDPGYRDFYRDIGFDLPLDYIGPVYRAEPDQDVHRLQVLGHHRARRREGPVFDPDLACAKVVRTRRAVSSTTGQHRPPPRPHMDGRPR